MTFMKISIFEYFNIKLLPKTVILMNFLITIDVWQAAKYLKVLEKSLEFGLYKPNETINGDRNKWTTLYYDLFMQSIFYFKLKD